MHAATIAEQRIKEKLPELPTGVPAASDKTQTQSWRLHKP